MTDLLPASLALLPLLAIGPAARVASPPGAAQEAMQNQNGDSQDVRALLDQAEDHCRRGNMDQAATILQEVLRRDPPQLAAAARLAGVLAEQGDWRASVALGNVQMSRGLPAPAVRSFEEALAAGCRSPRVHYQLARAYRQIGRPLSRIEIVPIAQAVPGRTYKQWYVVEPVAGEAKRFRVCGSNCAVYHLQKAIELGLDEPGMHLLHADTWFDAGRYARAREIYATIEQTVPTDELAGYHYRYGLTLYGLDDLDGFGRHFELAAARDPRTFEPRRLEFYTLMADRCCLHGELQRYIDYLQLAVSLAPRSVEHRYKLANALHEARRPDEARAQWQAVLQLAPNHPDRDRLLELITDRSPGQPSL